ncbi:ribosomal RNA small subunit methyltransferase G [Striga asiatica]|uniref:Ribosomal RNA small subunit methyltransferase G n=1 Tax=Striga asiatica TaxID=4170 RepID=A0A5A7P6X2_STRAF|nr:ribosomal RNA small subunit methyltransferase G [Striga asiatica]
MPSERPFTFHLYSISTKFLENYQDILGRVIRLQPVPRNMIPKRWMDFAKFELLNISTLYQVSAPRFCAAKDPFNQSIEEETSVGDANVCQDYKHPSQAAVIHKGTSFLDEPSNSKCQVFNWSMMNWPTKNLKP